MLAGCGDGQPALYPVSGKVLVDGKPAERAQVTFYTREGSGNLKACSFALTKADGSFRAFTFQRDDGVPAGDYAVTVVLPQYSENDDDDPGPDLLEGRYADPKSSKLNVRIQPNESELPPFSLTTAPP